jgi:hypothetical protein
MGGNGLGFDKLSDAGFWEQPKSRAQAIAMIGICFTFILKMIVADPFGTGLPK